MPPRDPLADGTELIFDAIAEDELGYASDAGGGGSMALAQMGGRQIEPVDAYLEEVGALGEDSGIVVGEAVREAMSIVSLGDLLSQMRYDAMDERWAQDEQTLLNMAFKNGHHYVEVDRSRRGVVAIPAPRNHVRRKVDKFGPWYRSQHGQLSANVPQAGISPKNRTQLDRDAAQYAAELREWVVPQAYSFQQRSQNAMWMMMGGVCVAYVGVQWTPDSEYEMLTGFSHRPDLDIEYLSPMECWTDNRHPCIRDMRWFGRDMYLPEAEARAMYLDDERQRLLTIESEAGSAEEHGYWTLRELQGFVGREDPWGRHAGPGRRVTRSDMEHEVIVAEFWGRKGLVLQSAFLDGLAELGLPDLTVEVLEGQEQGRPALVRFPMGLRVAFTADGHILEIRDNHTPGGALPFREFKLSQSAGFWTMPWATPLREINQAFDWIVSLREEHLIRTAYPTFLEPVDARVSRRQSMTGTSRRVRYRANRFGVKPEWADPPNMPADIVQFTGVLQELWMEIAGRREVSQGALPARLSGVAVSLLQEADALQLGFAGNELEDGHADVLRMAMLNVQAFFPEADPRLLRIAGDAPFKLQAFMQADLENDLNIVVQKGSAVPRSQAVVKQTAMELFTAGALVDPITNLPDVKRLMQVFEFGTEDELYGEQQLDEQNARDEEDLILQVHPLLAEQIILAALETGQLVDPFAPSPFDNHVVHERSHRMKLKLIESDERIPAPNKKLLELHWTITVQAALPVLVQTQPEVAAAFLPQLGAGGEGGEGEGDEGGEGGEADEDAA